jgi:hypothetical protein
MNTSVINAKRSGFIAGAAATLAIVAMGFAGAAQARDNVSFSVGIASPGVHVGVTNAYPVYTQPQAVYVQPQPVYVQPRPVYVQPAPVYVPRPVYYSAPPVYVQPAPVYYGRPHHGHRGHGHHYGHGHRGHKNHYGQVQQYQQQGYGGGHRPGYAPVYYQR